MADLNDFINNLLNKTRNEELKWKIVSNEKWDHLIFQKNFVYRSLEAEYKLKGKEYTVVLIEKKYEDPEHEYYYEKYSVEVLLLKDGSLITTISENEVDREELLKLLGQADMKSADLENFLEDLNDI